MTWHLNDNIIETVTEAKSFVIDFTSNNIQFKRIKITTSTDGLNISYHTTSSMGTLKNELQEDLLYAVVLTKTNSDNITETKYIPTYSTIIFNELPSGDLLAWLQANATPI